MKFGLAVIPDVVGLRPDTFSESDPRGPIVDVDLEMCGFRFQGSSPGPARATEPT
jgi:hypothetical protein